jgi:hypothetical protein
MRTIEIDDEVYTYLQSKAIAYEDTSPNLTLRRLFNMNNQKSISDVANTQLQQSESKRRKQPKTNLLTLIKTGLIKEGQKLYLHDYQGKMIPGYEATISGKLLVRNGKQSSMSDLAKVCLKENNYISDSVQGPARWFTSDGVSILKLWGNYLKKG